MSNLTSRTCVPCIGGVPALTAAEREPLFAQLALGWHVIEGHHLERTYAFSNFADALAFTNQVGELAEHEGHHPDIYLAWGKVQLRIWTHKINGLTESDFILAAKIDLLR